LSKAAGASTLTTLYFAPQCGQSISDDGGFDIAANMLTKIRKMKPDSATVGLCFRETGFCGAETAPSKGPVTFNPIVSRDKAPARKPTNSALFARHREISKRLSAPG